MILSGSYDGTARLWDAFTGREGRLYDEENYVRCVSFSPDGCTFVVGGGGFRIRDTVTGAVTGRWPTGSSIQSVQFSRDGKTLAWGTGSHALYVQVAGTDAEPRQFSPGYLRHVFGFEMALAPDGKVLVAGREGEAFRALDVLTGKELFKFGGEKKDIERLAFSPDGESLFSVNGDRTVSSWEPASGKELRRSDRFLRRATSLAFAPDGKTLALGNHDGSVTLWDVAAWKERGRFEGHRAAVKCVVFSPDGKLLASGSRDTTVLLWDVTGRLREKGPAPADPSPRAANALWDGLGSSDAVDVHYSLGALADAANRKSSVILDRVRPLFAADAVRVGRLIGELDDERFKVRERASRELERLEDAAEPALRRALAAEPSPEAQWRLARIFHQWSAGGILRASTKRFFGPG